MRYKGISEHKPVASECGDCLKIENGKCVAYVNPGSRHRVCECPLRTDKKLEVMKDKKVNPIKASKRKRR